MKSYSLDLREKVLNAVLKQGVSQLEVARTFGISRQFISNVLRRHRSGQSIAAKPRGGSMPKLTPAHDETLRQLVAEQNDRTIEGLRHLLVERGGPALSRATMGRALLRLRLPRKKRPTTTPSATARGSKG